MSDAMQQASDLYVAGRFDDAKAAYLAIAAHSPTDPVVHERLATIALWENRCDEAERHLEEAWRHLPWHRRFWPLAAHLDYRRATIHYRRDRFAQAASSFRRAAGPLAVGPFRELRALANQAALLGDRAAYVVDGPRETELPFLQTDPLPVVEVSVNDLGPLCFLIDTGGAELILDRDVAQRAGARLAGAIRADYAGDKSATTGLGCVEQVMLGQCVVRNVPIHTLDTGPIAQELGGTEIHGILGTRLLMHFRSTLDYINGRLILRRPRPAVEPESVIHGGTRIPFWLVEMHCMLAWGSINDLEPMLFFVDTGLGGKGFSASEDTLKRAGITVDWSTAQTGVGGAGTVRQTDFLVERLALGTGADASGVVVETKVPGVAIEGSVAVLEGKLGVRVGGLISHQFFRRHALTLDFEAMNLVVD